MISIIIPTYNSSSFIEETIGSIAAQTRQDLELIVVDDGSTDDTVAMISRMAFPVKLVRQQNRGRGAARNNGVSQATGEYIAFLDHDDLLLPGSIAARAAYLEAHPELGWVFTDATEFDLTGDLRLFLKQFPWLDLSQDHFCQLLRGCFPLTSTVMVRTELLRQVGGFNTDIDYGDDIELFLRLFLVSKVGMIDQPLTRRRIHPTQGVSSTFDRWDSRVKIYGSFSPSVGAMSPLQAAALDKALRYAYYKLGECYWEKDDYSVARKMFLKSLDWQPHATRALMYSLLCSGPGSIIAGLRKTKRSVS